MAETQGSPARATWDTEEAAQYLGCSPHTLRRWTCRGRVPHLKVGRLTRFLREDLDAFLRATRAPVQ